MAQAHKFRKAKSLFSTTLSAGISTGTGETITLASVTGLPTDTEITITIDRVDSAGTATPNAMERITGIISGSNLTAYTRAIDGTSDAAHSSGAVVEYIWNADDLNDLVDGILVGHNQDGTHDFATLYDANGNEQIKLTATASAVNEWTITNAATATGPTLEATGGDAAITPVIKGKSSFVKMSGIKDLGTVGATETVNWANGDRQTMTLDENVTITFSNAAAGQTLTLYMLQDGSGTNTITWADTIVWQDGITWGTSYYTTTADKWNVVVIYYTGSAYLGMVSKFA